MSGYAIVFGHCCNCGAYMGFNPHRVPSIPVKGKREPLCKDCHAKWNELHRTSKGLEPIDHHPDAYEPIKEEEL